MAEVDRCPLTGRPTRRTLRKPTIDRTCPWVWCSTCQESTPQSYIPGTERYACFNCRTTEWEAGQ